MSNEALFWMMIAAATILCLASLAIMADRKTGSISDVVLAMILCGCGVFCGIMAGFEAVVSEIERSGYVFRADDGHVKIGVAGPTPAIAPTPTPDWIETGERE